jgi:hypothetical protein
VSTSATVGSTPARVEAAEGESAASRGVMTEGPDDVEDSGVRARHAAHVRVLDAMRELRRDRPSGFARAYSIFELLLPEVLLRGASDSTADADRICDELSRRDYSICFRRWILLEEFERVVTTVVYFGTAALTLGVETIWPAWRPDVDAPVREMIKAVMLELVTAGTVGTPDDRALVRALVRASARGVPSDLSRARSGRTRPGRPRTAGIDGLCLVILREGLFKGGRPLASAVAQALKLAPPSWTSRSLRRRVERVRKAEVPIPSTWRDTLIAERLMPLYGDPLKPTEHRLKAVERIWERTRVGKAKARPTGG